MFMMKESLDNKIDILISQGTVGDIPRIALLFTESFKESVLHHCGGRLPKPKAMEDIFLLVYEAEPKAALLAHTIQGQLLGYCFAPTQLSGLWTRAVWSGHLLKWIWRWLTGQYGFGLYPVRLIVMNKLAFLRSALAPSRSANARILSIAVAQEARGQGVASKLIAAAVEYFKTQKVTKVRLEVRPENYPAIRVYEKWGFTRDGYTTDSQGEWLIMFKEMEQDNV